MPFERFTDVGRVFRPRASIRSNGQLGFNHGSIKRFEMDKFAYVVLFYDADTKRIGVQLTNNKDEPGASSLVVRSGNGAVSAKAFLEYYQLMPNKTKQYNIEKDKGSEMLIISLVQSTKED
jgi:hypothetical protein